MGQFLHAFRLLRNKPCRGAREGKEVLMKPSPRPADVSSPGRRRQEAQNQGFRESRPDADRIAQRAYDRFEARGREDGRDQEDWFEAERELQSVSPNSTAGGDEDVNSDEAA
jgi:hypothetical protein